MDIFKYGFVYIWFDSFKKMFYIGSHWGTENDGYICSSERMKNAFKKRSECFRRKIISKIYTNRNDLLIEEYKWLSMIKNEELGKKYYNMTKHHNGHWSTQEYKNIKDKISIKTKEAMQNPEIRKKYESGLEKRNTRSSDPEVRKKRSESMKLAMEKKFPNRIIRDKFASESYRKNMSQKTKQMWQNEEKRKILKQKISEGLIGRLSPVKDTYWWNDGTRNVRKKECPGNDWTKGKLKK